MKLTMKTYRVERVASADRTAWENDVLSLNFKELRRIVLKDEVFSDVSIEAACPGEKTRIVHILDAVPLSRMRLEGGGGDRMVCFIGDGRLFHCRINR